MKLISALHCSIVKKLVQIKYIRILFFMEYPTKTDNKLSINVNIADRYYPLRVERSDEEKIRKAAKQITDKVNQYKSKYTDKDIQDFLAMAALQFVTKLYDENNKADISSVIDSVKSLDDELEEYLNIVLSNN